MKTSAKIKFRGESICDKWSIKVQNHQGLQVEAPHKVLYIYIRRHFPEFNVKPTDFFINTTTDGQNSITFTHSHQLVTPVFPPHFYGMQPNEGLSLPKKWHLVTNSRC